MEFFQKQYKAVAIDLPGFGESTSVRTEWTIAKYSEDIINVIDELDLKNVILIGHSMAGEIILETALKNHQSIIGLVGVDNFKMIDVQLDKEQFEEMNSFFGQLENDFSTIAPVYAERMLFHESTDNNVRIRVKDDIIKTDPRIGFLSLSDLIKYSISEPAKLSQLNHKLYLINSDATPTNITGLEKYCKSSFEILDIHATGHYPMIEKADEFNELLDLAIKKIVK
jgi:pimeloyl-ACP methyl ester carboxylesterase